MYSGCLITDMKLGRRQSWEGWLQPARLNSWTSGRMRKCAATIEVNGGSGLNSELLVMT